MSYIAGDPGPRPRLGRGPWWVVGALVILLVVLAVAATAYAAWTHTGEALVVSLALSLLGFTSAVGLARLITGTNQAERRFREAEAAAAYARGEREETS